MADFYRIAPMKHQRLDGKTLPKDAERLEHLETRVARGEFEPLSFLIYGNTNLKDVTVTWTDFSGPSPVPASALDARIAKVWWSAHYKARMGNSDIGKTTPWELWKPRLTQDLLVHDDKIVRVHRDANPLNAKQEVLNEILVWDDTGNRRYVAIHQPDKDFPEGMHFQDARELAPFDVSRGHTKQIWLTLHVPEDADAGIYETTLSIQAQGEQLECFPLRFEVLPFDLEKPGLVYGLYYRGRFDIMNPPPVDRHRKSLSQYKRELADMRDHGFVYPSCQIDLETAGPEMLDSVLSIYKEVGLPTDKFIYARDNMMLTDTPEEISDHVRTWVPVLRKHNPEGVFYTYGLDERKGPAITEQLPKWKAVHEAGGKVWASISTFQFDYTHGKLDAAVLHGGHMVEDQNMNLGFDQAHREEIAKYHALEHEVWSYAHPFPAIEDPELLRRNYGIAMWKSGYDGAMIWCYQAPLFREFGYWNYRDCTLAFPTDSGVIPTIQWEGLREAVDDMRYVRTLQKKAVAAGKQTEIDTWLQELNPDEDDLDQMRSSIIDKILTL